jgi:hypothetical protein
VNFTLFLQLKRQQISQQTNKDMNTKKITTMKNQKRQADSQYDTAKNTTVSDSQTYISELYISEMKDKSDALANDYTVINTDLNDSAGGKYIWLCYKTTSNRADAITDICFVTGKDAEAPAGYSKLNTDLNDGAGGEYIYLCYATAATTGVKFLPIAKLALISGNSNDIKPEDGFMRINQDLNAGAGGKYIYLCFKYAEDGPMTKAVMIGVDLDDVKTSQWIKESGKRILSVPDIISSFICKKKNQAIVGRCHLKDENGNTQYKYGKVLLMNKKDAKKYDLIYGAEKYKSDTIESESNSAFICPRSCLIVGRDHQGDENGKTWYYYRKFWLEDTETKETFDLDFVNYNYTVEKKESSGEWAEYPVYTDNEKAFYAPMFGREHYGDENANTISHFTFLSARSDKVKSNNKDE